MPAMFDLARREEGRLALALSEITPEHRLIPDARGGGILCRGTPGSWANVGANLALAGPAPDDLADEILEWFASVGAEPRLEVTPAAHPSLLESLARRGWVLRLFENIFVRPLAAGQRTEPPFPLAPGVDIEPLDARRDADVLATAQAVSAGFAYPHPPSDADIALGMNMLRHPRSRTFVARVHGEVVGAGSCEIYNDIAALFGVSVLPGHRRKGIQQSLMARRLDLAAAHGCTLATISSRPGVATESNACRLGFTLGYTKAVLVRPGPGLAPVTT
jgi:GNAT superfamily N-acetyltransferase